MSAFAAVLVLLGMVLLVAAAIYAAARLLGVARLIADRVDRQPKLLLQGFRA